MLPEGRFDRFKINSRLQDNRIHTKEITTNKPIMAIQLNCKNCQYKRKQEKRKTDK